MILKYFPKLSILRLSNSLPKHKIIVTDITTFINNKNIFRFSKFLNKCSKVRCSNLYLINIFSQFTIISKTFTCMLVWIVWWYWRLFNILINLLYHFYHDDLILKMLISQIILLMNIMMFNTGLVRFSLWIHDLGLIVERFETTLDIMFHPILMLRRISIPELFMIDIFRQFHAFLLRCAFYAHLEVFYLFCVSTRICVLFNCIDGHFLMFIWNNWDFWQVSNPYLKYQRHR